MSLSIAKHPLREPLFQDMTEELTFFFFFPGISPKKSKELMLLLQLSFSAGLDISWRS